jgi:penicillin-binding protein 2
VKLEMFKGTSHFRLFFNVLAACLVGLPLAGVSWAAHINTTHTPAKKTSAQSSSKISETQHTRRRRRSLAHARAASGTVSRVSVTTRRRRSYERFHMSSFAEDITAGDITTGEDPIVRQAAVDALGNMNGTVVAIEPTSGRVLAMVNQKLALSSGAQPCSTIKLSVALAALSEGLISEDTKVALGAHYRMNLTKPWRTPTTLTSKRLAASSGLKKSPTTRINTDWASLLDTIFLASNWAPIPMNHSRQAGRRGQDVLFR